MYNKHLGPGTVHLFTGITFFNIIPQCTLNYLGCKLNTVVGNLLSSFILHILHTTYNSQHFWFWSLDAWCCQSMWSSIAIGIRFARTYSPSTLWYRIQQYTCTRIIGTCSSCIIIHHTGKLQTTGKTCPSTPLLFYLVLQFLRERKSHITRITTQHWTWRTRTKYCIGRLPSRNKARWFTRVASNYCRYYLLRSNLMPLNKASTSRTTQSGQLRKTWFTPTVPFSK